VLHILRRLRPTSWRLPGASPLRLAPVLLAAIALSGCGGDDDNPAGPGGTTGPMSAKIDGAAWAANVPYATAQAVASLPGAFIISGTSVGTGGGGLSILLSLYNVDGPGTYALGAGQTVFGGIASIGETTGGWGTPLTGAAGTVTITALSATQIAGTFSFTADASVGGATGTRVVTEGQFDLTLPGTALDPVPDNAGGRASATFDGAPFAPSTIVVNDSGGNLIVALGNIDRSLQVYITTFAGAGTYALSTTAPARTIQAAAGTAAWGIGGVTSGTIEVTSATATRVAGTFTATLDATGGTTATGPIAVSGSFDVGMP
jgi:hypothetical protein